jgi:hypothetical protein
MATRPPARGAANEVLDVVAIVAPRLGDAAAPAGMLPADAHGLRLG